MEFKLKRVLIILLFHMFFTLELKAEDLVIKSMEDVKKYSAQFRVSVDDSDPRYYSCKDLKVDFPSIRKGKGIQDVELTLLEADGKISMSTSISSSTPPQNPPKSGEKQPDITEDSSNRAYICLSEEQIDRAWVTIFYGRPPTLCIGNREMVRLHLKAFLSRHKLKEP